MGRLSHNKDLIFFSDGPNLEILPMLPINLEHLLQTTLVCPFHPRVSWMWTPRKLVDETWVIESFQMKRQDLQ